jgi:signal transduction histidine kinase
MPKLLVIFLISFLTGVKRANAQTHIIDSLKSGVNAAVTAHQKLDALLAFCDQGYTLHPDTLLLYVAKARMLAKSSNDENSTAWCMLYESSALTTKGLIDSSLLVAERCLKMVEGKMNALDLKANLYNQMGRCYMRKNMYKEAIEMGYRVIGAAEKNKNILLQIKGKTLIGWAYLEMGQTNEALVWHLNALRTTDDSLVLQKYAILFANLAINYRGLSNSDSAFFYIEKAILYARKHENLFALSNSLAIEGQLFVRAGKPKLAEPVLKEVVEIRKLIGDPFYLVSDMAQLGLYYANNEQPAKGIKICEEGIAIARQFGLGTKLFFLYSTLAENYKAMSNYSKYAEVLERIISLKDSVYQSNSAEALAEMQAKYELQRKENIIIQQKLSLVKKSYWMYGSLLLLGFGAMISYVLFRSYRRRQKLKLELMMQEEKRLGSEAIIRAEENERKRIAADLHDNMGAYASAISANLDDLMINHDGDQSMLLGMKRNVGDIMVNLRDTIWVLNREAILITGVSDRFKSYVQKIGRSYDGISIEIKEKITNNISFSPERALNMLRIMQEAFHNAIKHSRCTEIVIEIISEEVVTVRIGDNGIGIDVSATNVFGDGLHNMRRRAKANGWKLVVKNLIPEGTEIELISG